MEQSPRRQRLDRRLAKGRLRARHLSALARAVVARRGHAGARDGAVDAGTAAALGRRVADLTAKLEVQPSAELHAALGVLLAYQRCFLEDRDEVLARRVAEGRIGALHGALSAETIFIESASHVRFAPAAPHAWGDVAEDFARLALDLRRRGEAGAHCAEGLVAAYALHADDYDVYRVLDFYERDAACRLALEAASASDGAEPLAQDLLAGAPLVHATQRQVLVAESESAAKAVAKRLAAPRIVADERALERVDAVLAGGRSVVLEAACAELDAVAARWGALVLAAPSLP